MRGDTIVSQLSRRPWLILPAKAEELLSYIRSGAKVIEPKVEVKVEQPKPQAGLGDGKGERKPYSFSNGVATIPVRGTIIPRGDWMSSMSGLCTAEGVRRMVKHADKDEDVKTILLDIDSPGGYVVGIQETAKVLRQTKKKVVAAVTEGYSAAYWLASQADELYVTPSGGVGSIGVIVIHAEYSKQLEDSGIEVTIIRSPERKAEANPYEKLTKAAAKKIEEEVQKVRTSFESGVATGRKKDMKTVQEKFGQGTTLDADAALKVGMVDGIKSLEEVYEMLQTGTTEEDDGDVTVVVEASEPSPEPKASQGDPDMPDVKPKTTTAADATATVDHLNTKLTETRTEVAELKAKLAEERDARRKENAASLADSLPHLDAKREDLISLLTVEMPEEQAGILHNILHQANNQLADIPAIQQQARNKKGASVRNILESRAKELVKSGEAPNIKAAKGMVLEQDPDLGQRLMEASQVAVND